MERANSPREAAMLSDNCDCSSQGIAEEGGTAKHEEGCRYSLYIANMEGVKSPREGAMLLDNCDCSSQGIAEEGGTVNHKEGPGIEENLQQRTLSQPAQEKEEVQEDHNDTEKERAFNSNDAENYVQQEMQVEQAASVAGDDGLLPHAKAAAAANNGEITKASSEDIEKDMVLSEGSNDKNGISRAAAVGTVHYAQYYGASQAQIQEGKVAEEKSQLAKTPNGKGTKGQSTDDNTATTKSPDSLKTGPGDDALILPSGPSPALVGGDDQAPSDAVSDNDTGVSFASFSGSAVPTNGGSASRPARVTLPPGAYRVNGPNFNNDNDGNGDIEANTGVGEGQSTTPPPASRGDNGEDLEIPHVPEAFLVEDASVEHVGNEEVIIASRAKPDLPWWKQRRTKVLMLVVFILVVGFAVTLGIVFRNKDTSRTDDILLPTLQPSPSPTFDPRPTVEIVQDRGYVKCALRSTQIESGEGFHLQLCRAVAAVLLGNPDKIVGVAATGATRFNKLYDRLVDLVLLSVTHTIQREVREKRTGAGFTFTMPFYYDGMAYMGDETMVKCAEERMRFNTCSSLVICVSKGTTGYDFVQSSFPSDFIRIGSNIDERIQLLKDGMCNVVAEDRSLLLSAASRDDVKGYGFVVGDKQNTKEPLAAVTRKDDEEFSDVINWVLNALFFGEEQGLSKDLSLCQSYTNTTAKGSELNFMNAVYCVGNYGEIVFGDEIDRGMNQINDGSTGMHYSRPFGDLNSDDGDNVATDAHLSSIREGGMLHCGVLVPNGFVGDIAESDNLVGMSVDYCRTLAAALFNGNPEEVKFYTFSENAESSSFAALDNGTIDVLAGARVSKKYEFATSSRSGFHFSTPYYYGNETAVDDVSMITLATREDDVVFSSFVNLIVLAIIDAQEMIDRGKGGEMPLMSVFGSEFNWALRDAVSYSGGYDQFYTKHFGQVSVQDRGRNTVNINGGAQIHSFPGFELSKY